MYFFFFGKIKVPTTIEALDFKIRYLPATGHDKAANTRIAKYSKAHKFFSFCIVTFPTGPSLVRFDFRLRLLPDRDRNPKDKRGEAWSSHSSIFACAHICSYV